MFKRLSGEHKVEWYPKTASTAFTLGGLVDFASGLLTPADASSTIHVGIILRAVVAADADYADANEVPLDVPAPNDVFEVGVSAGTPVQATHVGNTYDLDATGALVDLTAASATVVRVVGIVNSTKILVKINSMIGVTD